MQHRNHSTRLSLVAMLASSVYLAACGGSGGVDTRAPLASPPADAAGEPAEIQGSYTWTKVADEGQNFTLPPSTRVRYGSGKYWVYKYVSGTATCSNAFFGSDPAPGVVKECDTRGTTTVTTTSPPPAPTCPCSVWSASTTPAVTQENDPNAVELGVKFTTSSDGFITGIRFYKGSGNTGTHVGNLWSASGALLARATFTAETASGWQQVTFATPVAVTANTVYVASYYAPAGNYAADLNFFAANGVTTGPLTMLSNGAASGNGVYKYAGATSFPSQTYNSTNYWVDVVFNTTSTVTTDTGTGGTGTGTGTSTGTANLTWTASPDTGVTGYRVYYGTASGTYLQSSGQGIAAGNVASYTVSGLASGKTYYFAVTAIDAAGHESAPSAEATKVMP